MKVVKVLFQLSMILLTVVLLLVKTNRIPAHSMVVIVAIGLVMLFGGFVTVKLILFEMGFEKRLERLVTLRAARDELDSIEAQVLNQQAQQVGQQFMNQSEQAGHRPPLTDPTLLELPPVQLCDHRKQPQEPEPDSRLARILRDDYPL